MKISVFKSLFLSITFLCCSSGLNLLATPDVDTSLNLCPDEVAFMQKRDVMTQAKTLEFVQDIFGGRFNKSSNRLPRIGFCFSGGGVRALLKSLGFMQGMEDIGLLNCVSYSSFLSGSSWFYITYLLKNMDLAGYREFIQGRLELPFNKGLYGAWSETGQIARARGYYSISDGYGKSVYDYLVGGTVPQDATFMQIREQIAFGRYNFPFPLFTAIVKDKMPYKWLEVTPFTAGSDELGGYVKTSLWGSYFNAGACVRAVPELTLASFMGIFGSAYCINEEDFKRYGGQESLKSQAFYYYLEKSVGRVVSTEYLLFAAMRQIESRSMFENFMCGINVSGAESHNVVVADAGLDFNVPTPPLLKKERGVDVIFICDASAYSENESEQSQIAAFVDHASRNGIRLPDMTNPIVVSDNIFVFEDNDSSVPTIVYCKLSSAFSTFKFDYTKLESDAVCDSARFAINNAKDAMVLAIRRKAMALNQPVNGIFRRAFSYVRRGFGF